VAIEAGKKAPAFTLTDAEGNRISLSSYAGKDLVLYCYPRDDTPYGAWGEKVLYGKKTTGVIRSTVWIGPDGKVKKHWARVAKAEAHPEQVLAALRGE
jgi:peroxiredoxin